MHPAPPASLSVSAGIPWRVAPPLISTALIGLGLGILAVSVALIWANHSMPFALLALTLIFTLFAAWRLSSRRRRKTLPQIPRMRSNERS